MVAVLAWSQTRGGLGARAIACPTARADTTRGSRTAPRTGDAAPAVPGSAPPRAQRGPLPRDTPPWLSARSATEHDDVVSAFVEGAGGAPADLAGPPRNDD